MATATLYTTAKRHNSTLQPSSGTDINVDLKGGADLNSPTFLLQYTGVPNYSIIKFEGKYYFIDLIRNVRNELWELDCSVDVLGTYKSDILASSAFVLYHTHANSDIVDKRLSTKTTITRDTHTGVFDTLGSGGGSNNVIIVNVTGKDSCASYAMSQDSAKNLLSNFDNWYSEEGTMPPVPENPFEEVVNALQYFCEQVYHAVKQLLATGKADDSIRSAVMLPLPVSAIAGTSEEIVLGQYETGVNGTRISNRIFADGCDVSIPWQATDWRRNAPYHEIYLYIPYVGLVSISPSDVIGVSSIHVSVSLDVTSGDAIFTCYAGSFNHVIGQYHTNLGASYAIGSSNVTPVQSASAIIAAVGGVTATAATGGLATLGATAGLSGLVNAINGQPNTIGSNSGGAGLGISSGVKCFTIFHDTTVTPSSVSDICGTPTNAVMALSGISGYVQTCAASVSGSMTDNEREEINNLLDGGIYIE